MPDLSVWIEVDGQPVPCYGVEIEGSRSSAYIEAVEGAHFAVRYVDNRATPPTHSYSANLWLDGQL